MARAAKLRLRAALEEYVAENAGDGSRARARGTDAEIVKQAQALLKGFGPGETAADTPGRRAANTGESPGRALDSAKERAREILAGSAQRTGAGDGDQ